jgi:hypothetical protein
VTMFRPRPFKFALRRRIAVLSGIALGFAAATTLVLGSAAPALASGRGNYSNCENTHCYSLALSPDSMSGSPYQGARATMYLINMKSGGASASNPAHINSTLWTNQDDGLAYEEEGVTDGWVGANGTHPCQTIPFGPTSCIYYIDEPGSGGSSTCINSGCDAYAIYWADTRTTGTTTNQYVHIVKYTSPSPSTQLYVDDGYNSGNWVVHLMSSALGLNYYGTSTINDDYQYVQDIRAGAELEQVANAGACADTQSMTFAMWDPPSTFNTFDAQVPTTASVATSTFNGTQQTPGTNPGTWLWNLPTSGNPNGC